MTEFYEPEVAEGDNDDELGEGDDDNVIVSGDPSAAANAQRDNSSIKDKRIPDAERNTTPYMTKYERARILGTRALQIRYVAKDRSLHTTANRIAQHERACAGRLGRRDGSPADCHQGVAREEDSPDCAKIHARRIVSIRLLLPEITVED